MTDCATCERTDDPVGWTICDTCFHKDRFDGFAYWTPVFCALMFLVAASFFVATMMELAR